MEMLALRQGFVLNLNPAERARANERPRDRPQDQNADPDSELTQRLTVDGNAPERFDELRRRQQS